MSFLQIEFGSYILNHNTTLYVVLPQGQSPNDPIEDGVHKYKTLYLLHGYNGNHSDWMRYTAIERYAEKYRLAIVMPQANNSYYTNMAFGPKYFDFIANEVPEYLKTVLPLASKPENTYIAGLSMGGYGALKIGLTYPERFKAIAGLSSAIDIDWIINLHISDPVRTQQMRAIFGSNLKVESTANDLFAVASRLNKRKKLPQIYFSCGTEDFLYQSNLKFKDHLKDLKIEFTFESYPGDHNWQYWDLHIQTVLNWFFK